MKSRFCSSFGYLTLLLGSLALNLLLVFTSTGDSISAIKAWRSFSSAVTLSSQSDQNSDNLKPNVFMFIAIGSSPHYVHRRHEQRRTWLQWAELGVHEYRFFTEIPSISDNPHLVQNLMQEQREFGDLVFLNGSSIGRRGYGTRGVETLKWAQRNFNFSYLMKTDDDSFACLPSMTNELMYHRPRDRFVWGKYWYRMGNAKKNGRGRTRMDENLMIFSSDIVKLLAENIDMLAFDGDLTFAVNFAFWSHFLNLTVFDDRYRIDAQQHYLTQWMHEPYQLDLFENGTYAKFCNEMIYAHHVSSGLMDLLFQSMDHGKEYIRHGKDSSPVEITRPQNDTRYSFNTQRFPGKLPKCECKF